MTKPKQALHMVNSVPIKGTKLHLVHTDMNWLNIPYISDQYNGKYIGEFALRTMDGGWSNFAAKLFYTKDKHPKGSNYMALYIQPMNNKLFITDGAKIAENVWTGVLNEEDNVVLYSAYRHDYQELNGMIADGGPEYIRSTNRKLVQFTIKDGEIVLVERVDVKV